MFVRPILSEGQANLILEVAKAKSVADLSNPETRIGNAMSADNWKAIAKSIEAAISGQL